MELGFPAKRKMGPGHGELIFEARISHCHFSDHLFLSHDQKIWQNFKGAGTQDGAIQGGTKPHSVVSVVTAWGSQLAAHSCLPRGLHL